MWQFSWKSQKKIFDPFFKIFLTNQGNNENEDEKSWKNEFNFWILHIKIRLYGTFRESLWKTIFDPFFRTFLTNWGKNEDENEKLWKNRFSFWVLHIKIRLCGSFHENLKKNFLTHFLRHFWLIKAKMKIKIKKFGKMN